MRNRTPGDDAPPSWSSALARVFRHRWMDDADARRAVPVEMADRLARRVAASEARHSGEVRFCVEAGLPASYLWRRVPIKQAVRERAVMMFSKLRVWDTERNNGVLIYLLLAEHAIEIVADRGIARQVPSEEWRAITGRMSAAFKDGRFEDGLTQALEEVSALLVAHFPAGGAGDDGRNELPDAPVVGSG